MTATIHHADQPDSVVVRKAVAEISGVMLRADVGELLREVVADKGYHRAEMLAWLSERGIRSHIPEMRAKAPCRCSDTAVHLAEGR
ncbi:MAG: hypothetical protein AB7I19_13250 [Planctomycetota bacterium]